MTNVYNTAFFFLSLIVYYRDQAVLAGFSFDRSVGEYEVGMDNEVGVADIDFKLARVRQIRDVLNNSVRDLYKRDQSVTEWVDSLGGFKKVQEKLLGLKLGPKSWYGKVCRELRDRLGGTPSALGEPAADIHVDTATSHTAYAVQVHRDLANQEAYGQYHDEEEERTTPNWALSDHDFDVQRTEYDGFPYWWKFISMGRFRAGKGVKAGEVSKNLIQKETSHGPLWIPDIRISKPKAEGLGWVETPFIHITAVGRWAIMQEHLVVKELINRFYNNPKRLTWQRVGYGEKTRWACGMPTSKGTWIWCPVSHPSSNKMDWYFKNEGKAWTPRLKRAIYVKDSKGDWVIQYGKRGDKIRVVKMKQNDATGLFEIWKEIDLDWQDWGKMKKIILAMGGKDAYLGYPGKGYVVPEQYKRKGPTAEDLIG